MLIYELRAGPVQRASASLPPYGMPLPQGNPFASSQDMVLGESIGHASPAKEAVRAVPTTPRPPPTPTTTSLTTPTDPTTPRAPATATTTAAHAATASAVSPPTAPASAPRRLINVRWAVLLRIVYLHLLACSSAFLHTAPRCVRRPQHLSKEFRAQRGCTMAEGREKARRKRADRPQVAPPEGTVAEPKGRHGQDYHTGEVLGFENVMWNAVIVRLSSSIHPRHS
jgi:hypothetical protein